MLFDQIKTDSVSGNKQGIDHLNTSLNTDGGLFTGFCKEKGIEGDELLFDQIKENRQREWKQTRP